MPSTRVETVRIVGDGGDGLGGVAKDLDLEVEAGDSVKEVVVWVTGKAGAGGMAMEASARG